MKTNKFMMVGITVLLCMGMTACGKDDASDPDSNRTEPDTTVQEEVDPVGQDRNDTDIPQEKTTESDPLNAQEGVYQSADGWTVEYDSDLIEVNENGSQVYFVYVGECGGTNLIGISYYADKMPTEVLYDAMSERGEMDEDTWTRSEGFFAGDKWSYSAYMNRDGDGSTEAVGFTAAEYNGGTILIEKDTHVETDEANGIKISDTLAEILNSMTFDNYEPQTEFYYIPGTYQNVYEEEIGGSNVKHTNEVVLREDHTGTLTLQDTVNITWGSNQLMGTDSDMSYEYTVEGDQLYVNIDDEMLEFKRVSE